MLKVLGLFIATIAAALLVTISFSAFLAIGVYKLPQESGIPCLLVFGLGLYCTPALFRAVYSFFERAQIQQQQHIQHQKSLSIALSGHIKESAQAAASLSQLAGNADSWVEVAEREFAQRAFASFWDAIAAAASNLAEFNSRTHKIIAHAHQHRREASEFEGTPQPFHIGMDTLPDASRVAARMQRIVRKAQTDFEFAVIFEQRRTNELLFIGFNGLTDAVNGLGDRLQSSLDQLSEVVSISVSDLSAAQERATSAISTEIQASRSQSSNDIASTNERVQRIGDTLDAIQESGLFPPRQKYGKRL